MTNGKNIPKRSLGSSGIKVSAIGLGCMSLSGVYSASSDEDGIALIHEALDRSVTFLDTSDMYGFGHNEEIVGKAIKGRRSEVVLATKFGNLGGRGGKIADGRPEYVLSACEASLKRLGVEVKVRALGLSEARPETIRRAHAVHHCRHTKRVLVALPGRGGGDAAHDPRAEHCLCGVCCGSRKAISK